VSKYGGSNQQKELWQPEAKVRSKANEEVKPARMASLVMGTKDKKRRGQMASNRKAQMTTSEGKKKKMISRQHKCMAQMNGSNVTSWGIENS